MNLTETAQVLAKVQLGDNRVVDALTVREWHDAIGHLAVHEAIEAVRLHRRESLDYLMPAHVVAGARRVRAAAQAEQRKDRQLESRRDSDVWREQGSGRDRVWRAMLDDPDESERTKAWIRGQLEAVR